MLKYALLYAKKGLAVFPIKARGKTPLTKNGFKDATTSVTQIKKWWEEFPNANIGIATGKVSGNVFVIDLDEDDDKGVSGFHTLKDWERDNGELPPTVNSITGRGGYHYFYKADQNIKIQSRIGLMEGIDIRGEGGYIVAPPSIHPNGRPYEWEMTMEETGIAPANEIVMNFLSQKKDNAQYFKIDKVIPDGQRNGTLYSLACSLQSKGLSDSTILEAVKMENRAKCNPPLEDTEIEQLVNSALTKDKGEIKTTARIKPVARQFITLKTKTNAKGEEVLLQSIENVETVLEMDEQLANKIFFNCLSYSPYVKGRLPWSVKEEYREWNNFDDSNLKSYLESNYGLSVDRKVIDGLNNVVNRHRFNPVVDWLESIQFDGQDHISHLLPDYLGVEDNDYQREALKTFMLGAISRAYEAGKKFDYMLVLVGEQGAGKSTFFRKLAGNENWYDDNFNVIEGDKATEKLRGMWIVELAELIATKRAKEVEAIKSFLTSTTDNYRPPYARLTEQRPRCCVFTGTTNSMHFLTDRTGNRRFLPFVVDKSKATKDLFSKDTDEDFRQAWGQALQIYKSGDFKLVLPKHLEKFIEGMQKNFLEEDSRVGLIQMYLDQIDGAQKVCVMQIWEKALGMIDKPLDRRTSNELHDIMCHSIEGWERVKNTSGGRVHTPYGTQICYQKRSELLNFQVVPPSENVPF